jgi:hypothetical protein
MSSGLYWAEDDEMRKGVIKCLASKHQWLSLTSNTFTNVAAAVQPSVAVVGGQFARKSFIFWTENVVFSYICSTQCAYDCERNDDI